MIYPDLKEIVELEGDENTFDYKGYKCHIRRVGIPYMGHLCGYIEIPADHELYEMDYDEIEDKYQGLLPAHGGLTFSDFVDNKYWIGFDCAHYRDLKPMYIEGFEEFRDKRDVYRDMDYVAKNIKQIVDFIEQKKPTSAATEISKNKHIRGEYNMNFNYDKALADEASHLLPNINQHVGLDEYGEEALLDWQGKQIDAEDRVFVIRFKKTIGTIVPHAYVSDDFFNTYLACDDNLIDLLDEKDTELYWSMDITTGGKLLP